MARIRNSDGTTRIVSPLEIWGKPQSAKEIAQETRRLSPPVTRVQLAIALASRGIISAVEAKDFAAGNSLPEKVASALDGMDEAERMVAEIKALASPAIHRLDPLFVRFQSSIGMSEDDADKLFEAAGSIK